VIGKPVLAREQEHVAGAQLVALRCVFARFAANAEYARIAERDGEHRRCEILLVLVLVQAHLGRPGIIVDEAGLGRLRVA
jgi:hypothetical protein